MKIVNKFKFIRTCSILSILLVLFIIFSNHTYSKVEINYRTEYICRGETLWNIASNERENNPYFQNKDIRYVINELQNINNLHSSNLIEGMQIKIPIYK